MGDTRGFLKVKRQKMQYRPVCERIQDYKDVFIKRSDKHSVEQASRCMDCGTPFCHWGCPVANLIPEWNDLVFGKKWEAAYQILQSTNNLPEITGRICPALCEFSCVLGINDEPVSIRENELSIIEHAYENNFVKPNYSYRKTGKKVAVIGSGPAGLACADQLSKAGHEVVVFEKDAKIGGILRFGIPDFKLEKWVLDRRLDIMRKQGVNFSTGINIGLDYKISKLNKEFDAACLCCGSRVPRDLNIDGRNLKGIYFAMDYLVWANKINSGEKIDKEQVINAKGKKVVIIGGGDTGADCIGVAHRQGAKCIVQIELLSRPSECRTDDYPWPFYPLIFKTSTSHEEGGERHWSVLTKRFVGENSYVKKIVCSKVEFYKKDEKSCPVIKELPGTEFEIEADLVILAIGFLHPQKEGLLKDLDLMLDSRGNIKTDESYMTSKCGIFAAGDTRRGQSLIVWAISEGRRTAHFVDKFLEGKTNLPLL